MQLAFGDQSKRHLENLLSLATKEFPPSFSKLWEKRSSLLSLLHIGARHTRKAPVTECTIPHANLLDLPMIKSWPLDGGEFLTLPLVYTEHPEGMGAPNLGMYRIQRYDSRFAGLHWQIGKGGGFHYHAAEKLNKALPVTIFLGGPPALILSAIAPLPENVPELLLCSFLLGEKLSKTKIDNHPHSLISECEFALVGESLPHERRLEGPFGDHYGYYSWAHEYPIFTCKKIYHRKDAIYPATIVGKPRQEDFYIGDYLQDLLSPLFPIVMPGVKDLWSYGETGFHSLGAAVVKERYYRECMSSAFRILGEGQLSLTKFLILLEDSINLKDFKAVLKHALERFKPQTDLFIFANLSLDTLDYTGPALNKGSRGVMVATGKAVRTLPEHYSSSLPKQVTYAQAFVPGCLVLSGHFGGHLEGARALQELCNDPLVQQWPLLILVDNVEETNRCTESFLWTVFTRFEPAADIYAAKQEIYRNHIQFHGSILIDARMKPDYPPVVECDEKTKELVDKRWNSYF